MVNVVQADVSQYLLAVREQRHAERLGWLVVRSMWAALNYRDVGKAGARQRNGGGIAARAAASNNHICTPNVLVEEVWTPTCRT